MKVLLIFIMFNVLEKNVIHSKGDFSFITSEVKGVTINQFKNTYYLLICQKMQVEILTSSDLSKWSTPRTILSLENQPTWVDMFLDIELFISEEGQFVVYFDTSDSLGVARADTFSGPFTISELPLLTGLGQLFGRPNILQHNGKLIIFFRFTKIQEYWDVKGRFLEEGGLSFTCEDEKVILFPNLKKEKKKKFSFRIFRYHNMFYCITAYESEDYFFIAHSIEMTGPFIGYTSIEAEEGITEIYHVFGNELGEITVIYWSDARLQVVSSTLVWPRFPYASIDSGSIDHRELALRNQNIRQHKFLENGLPWLAFTVAIIFIAAVMASRRYKKIKEKKRKERKKSWTDDSGLESSAFGIPEDINLDTLPMKNEGLRLASDCQIMEFAREKLILEKQIGAGCFGVVYKGEAEGISEDRLITTVAVKMVKDYAEEATVRSLLKELKIMASLGNHPNIVNLLGACTDNLTKKELLIIVEYCKFGNLRDFLVSNRSFFFDQLNPATDEIEFCGSGSGDESDNGTYTCDAMSGYTFAVNLDSANKTFCSSQLVSWACQIVFGMEYLAGKNVLHGDLAARNVLLAENDVVKICDFGLSRNIYRYREYRKMSNDPLPWRWMAIESMRDSLFSTQSDVWAYGIVLWELFTLAQTPYPGIPHAELLNTLLGGYRLLKPAYCPAKLYKIMRTCWDDEPTSRPTFGQLSEQLKTMFKNVLTEAERAVVSYT